MSSTNPAPAVENTITTIFDKIAPFLPRLAQKVPVKYRNAAYVGIPVAVGVFDALCPTLHVSALAEWITDTSGTLLLGALAAGNADISKG